jgi:hypothetical protein
MVVPAKHHGDVEALAREIVLMFVQVAERYNNVAARCGRWVGQLGELAYHLDKVLDITDGRDS